MRIAVFARPRLAAWEFDWGHLSVHLTAIDGTPRSIVLTNREFQLALALYRHLGHPVSRTRLLEALGVGSDRMPGRALDNHIYRLRRKLGPESTSGLRLHTVYGSGYRLEQIGAHVQENIS